MSILSFKSCFEMGVAYITFLPFLTSEIIQVSNTYKCYVQMIQNL